MTPRVTFQCSLDGAPFATCTTLQNFSSLAEGSHTFEVRSVDLAGNLDLSPASYTWIVDLTAPALTYTPLGYTTSTSARTLTLNITDSGAGVQTPVSISYYINGGGPVLLNCSPAGGNNYNCVIPGQPVGTAVRYAVFGQDLAANPFDQKLDAYTVGAATIPSGQYNHLAVGDGTTTSTNTQVSEALTLSGIGSTGANTLQLLCGVTVTGAGPSAYLVGTVEWQICANTTYTFPVGTTPNGSARNADATDGEGDRSPEGVVVGEYSPVTIVVNSFSGGPLLAVKPNDTWMPGLGTTGSLSRHWDVIRSGGGDPQR